MQSSESVLLGALLAAHPGPLSRSEIATQLQDPITAAMPWRPLCATVWRSWRVELVFASRAAAVRTDQLTV